MGEALNGRDNPVGTENCVRSSDVSTMVEDSAYLSGGTLPIIRKSWGGGKTYGDIALPNSSNKIPCPALNEEPREESRC